MIQIVNSSNNEKYGVLLRLVIIVQWLNRKPMYNGNKQVVVSNLMCRRGGIATLSRKNIINSSQVRLRSNRSKSNQIEVVLEMHNLLKIQLKDKGRMVKLVQQ